MLNQHSNSPVRQKGAEDHEAVLNLADRVCSGVPTKKQLSPTINDDSQYLRLTNPSKPVFEGEKLQLLCAPFNDYSLQFGLDVLFLHGRDTDVLDVLLVREKRSLHDVPQGKTRPLQVKLELGKVLDPRPVSELHRLVGHQLKDRADVAEVVDDLLQILERWPLLTIRDEWFFLLVF